MRILANQRTAGFRPSLRSQPPQGYRRTGGEHSAPLARYLPFQIHAGRLLPRQAIDNFLRVRLECTKRWKRLTKHAKPSLRTSAV